MYHGCCLVTKLFVNEGLSHQLHVSEGLVSSFSKIDGCGFRVGWQPMPLVICPYSTVSIVLNITTSVGKSTKGYVIDWGLVGTANLELHLHTACIHNF